METLNFTEDQQYNFRWHETVHHYDMYGGYLLRFVTADNMANRFLIEAKEPNFFYGRLQREGEKILPVKFEITKFFKISLPPSFEIDGCPPEEISSRIIELEPITLLELGKPLQC